MGRSEHTKCSMFASRHGFSRLRHAFVIKASNAWFSIQRQSRTYVHGFEPSLPGVNISPSIVLPPAAALLLCAWEYLPHEERNNMLDDEYRIEKREDDVPPAQDMLDKLTVHNQCDAITLDQNGQNMPKLEEQFSELRQTLADVEKKFAVHRKAIKHGHKSNADEKQLLPSTVGVLCEAGKRPQLINVTERAENLRNDERATMRQEFLEMDKNRNGKVSVDEHKQFFEEHNHMRDKCSREDF